MGAGFFALGLVGCAAPVPTATGSLLDPAALDLPVEQVRLENGLRFLILPRPQAPTVAVSVAYPVGSADDPVGGSGTAHLLEHLLFKGSTTVGSRDYARERPWLERLDTVADSLNRSELTPSERERLVAELIAARDSARAWVRPNEYASLLEEHGAVGLNATTTVDATTYYVELPANRLEVWMILEADRLRHAVLREFEAERAVVLEERRMRIQDDPAGRLYEAHLAATYGDHPYGRTPVGRVADLTRATRASVAAFYAREYRTDRAAIAIVGDVDPGQVRRQIEQHFGPVEATSLQAPRATPTAPAPTGITRFTLNHDAELRMRMGWLTVSGDHPDAPALSVLASILAGGRTSRLHRRLVSEDRLASYVGVGSGPGGRFTQVFSVDVTPRSGISPDTVEATIRDELGRLLVQPPSPHELDRIRTQLAAGALRRLRSNLGLALELSAGEALHGDWRHGVASARRMAAVTQADLAHVVTQYLQDDRLTVGLLGRIPEQRVALGSQVTGDSAAAPELPPVRSVLPAVTPSASASAREQVRDFRPPRLHLRPPALEQHRLEGATVVLAPEHSLPLVDVIFHFRGGPTFFPRTRLGAASALPALLRSGGADGLPPDSVDALVEGWALETAFGGGGQALVSSLGVLTSQLGPALDLWTDILARPRFDANEVELWRAREVDQIRRRGEAPAGVAYSRFNELMFGDHPIGWELDEPDLTPERVSRSALLAMHRATLCAENLIVGVSGDTDWRTLRPMLRRLVVALPRCPRPLGPPPEARVRDQAGWFVVPADVSQSTIVLGTGTQLQQADTPEFFAAQVANRLLGGSGLTSRVSQRLRTREGLAYSASTLWTTPPAGDGVFAAVVQTRAEATDQAIATLTEELRRFRSDGPGADEVARAVRELTHTYAFAFRDARQVVVRRLAYLRQGLPDDWLERRAARIGAVRAQDVHEVFRTHVDPARLTVLVVGDTASITLPDRAQILR